eukprot:3818558-Rhodomonas_salina.2
MSRLHTHVLGYPGTRVGIPIGYPVFPLTGKLPERTNHNKRCFLERGSPDNVAVLLLALRVPRYPGYPGPVPGYPGMVGNFLLEKPEFVPRSGRTEGSASAKRFGFECPIWKFW